MTPLVATFLLSIARLLGVAIALPSVAGRSYSTLRYRVAGAVLLACLLAPACQLNPELLQSLSGGSDIQWEPLVIPWVTELLVGLVLGVGIHVIFAGVQVVSQVLGTASGLSMGSFLGGGSATAPLTRFLDFFSLAVFLAMGGHRMIVEILLVMMREVPLGTSQFQASVVGSLASLLTLSFAMGLRSSFPVLVSLLTAIIAVGALSRFLPKFQVFVSATGLNSVVLIGSLFVFMGTIGWSLQEQIPVYLERLVACIATTV